MPVPPAHRLAALKCKRPVSVTTTLAFFSGPCSTYFSFCGNAGGDQSAGDLRTMICNRWLRPVSSNRHPKVSGWVLYGEGLEKLPCCCVL